MESGPPDYTSEILKNCFSVEYNLNGTFGYACRDSESIDMQDFYAFQSSYLYLKYKETLIIAYCSLKLKQDPLKPFCTDSFYLAKMDIIKNLKQFPDLHLELKGKYP
jgi:hypothetical protein